MTSGPAPAAVQLLPAAMMALASSSSSLNSRVPNVIKTCRCTKGKVADLSFGQHGSGMVPHGCAPQAKVLGHGGGGELIMKSNSIRRWGLASHGFHGFGGLSSCHCLHPKT